MKTQSNNEVEFEDYRVHLKKRMDEFLAQRPYLSLRGVARKIGMDQSYLSQFLKGKKHAGRETTRRIAQFLRMDTHQTQGLLKLAEFQRMRSSSTRVQILEELRESNFLAPTRTIQALPAEEFNEIGEWYYLPILELRSLKGFNWSPSNIAHRLGISVDTAFEAVDKLSRLHLISDETNSDSGPTSPLRLTPEDGAQDTLQYYQKQVIQRALKSQELHGERENTAITIAVSPAGLDRAQKLIREFQMRFATEVSAASGECDQVFQLNLNFFKIDQNFQNEPVVRLSSSKIAVGEPQ